MVASISSPIDTLLQGATRARAPGRTCTAVPTLPCKPNSRCDLRETNLTPDTRWGSRSRDPIGYAFIAKNLYEYCNAMPILGLDSLGLFFAPPKVHGCDTMFAWMLPDPTAIPNLDFAAFAECMMKEIQNGKKPKDAINKCAGKLANNLKDDSINWYAHTACCFAYEKEKDYDGGDPCKYGSAPGTDVGVPRPKCWKLPEFPQIPEGPAPRHAHECCYFKACVSGIKAILGEKPDPFSLIDCLADAPL